MTLLKQLILLALVIGTICLALWAALLPARRSGDRLVVENATFLEDIRNFEERVASLSPAIATNELPQELLWVGNDTSEVELALQSIVVEMAENQDIALTSFGSSYLTRESQTPVFSFELEAETSLDRAYAFIAALETLTPRVAIGSLRLRPQYRYDGDQSEDVTVFLHLTLWAFWKGDE